MVLNICMKFHEDIFKGFKVIEQTQFCHRNCYIQSSKVYNLKNTCPRVMVLCSARYLKLVHISMKFHEDILNGFKVIELARFVIETATYKVQRGITQKYIQELWFLRSARCPILVNIYMTFHDDILNGYKLQSRHDFFTDRRTDGWTDRRLAKTIYLPTLKGERHNYDICPSNSLQDIRQNHWTMKYRLLTYIYSFSSMFVSH